MGQDTLDRLAEDLSQRAQEARERQTVLMPTGFGQRMNRIDTPHEMISLAPFQDIISYQPEDLVVTVEAGTSMGLLNQELKVRNQWIPVEMTDGKDDSVGGLVSAGLDGSYSGGYGWIKDRVLALDVWTPGFGRIRAGAPVVKNVAGYNLPRLFLGSRGQFGIILSVTLKVSPRPAAMAEWDMAVELDEAPEQVERILRLARPFARILGWNEGAQYHIRAAWHGSQSTIGRLSRELGTPVSDPRPFLVRGSHSVTGAIPKTGLTDIIKGWPDQALVEWQSGWFWAELADDEAVHRLRTLVTRHGGYVSSVTGDPARVLPPGLESVYLELKQRYDPSRILPRLVSLEEVSP